VHSVPARRTDRGSVGLSFRPGTMPERRARSLQIVRHMLLSLARACPVRHFALTLGLLSAAVLSWGAGFRAGAARIDITPEGPIWLSGYAVRDHPSEGVDQRLYARALALEDPRGHRFVIVSLDLIGVPRNLADEVAARAAKRYGLQRSELLLNASHTHAGPVVWPNLSAMYDLPKAEKRKLIGYRRRLADSILTVIGAALGRLAPARLAFGEGSAGFAINRREFQPDGTVKIGVNPDGPVDHSVPVIRVNGEKGKLLAVVFGYACHNTTLTGKNYRISGDYAGFAAVRLETAEPDSVALFLALCGGDQNPHPRTEPRHVVQHGTELATAVRRVLEEGGLEELRPPLRSAFQLVDLRFRHHTRTQYEKDLKSENRFIRNRARLMLEAYDARRPVRSIPYPVQAVRFGDGLAIVALGGEVVVDYALRAKREYAGHPLVVAGYSNDVMGYIPSLRVLKEGGYEPERSTIYYGLPGPFADDVEETIFDTIHQVLRRVGLQRPQ